MTHPHQDCNFRAHGNAPVLDSMFARLLTLAALARPVLARAPVHPTPTRASVHMAMHRCCPLLTAGIFCTSPG